MQCATRSLDTPLGRYRLTASPEGLQAVTPEPEDGEVAPTGADPAIRRHLDSAVAALQAYFDGDPGPLERLVLAPRGTPFQRRVWDDLRRIPFGETASYAQVAGRIGREGAARAVGGASGRNPLAIVVPCHRVVGARGRLTGYAGGLARKRWLLRHEGAAP